MNLKLICASLVGVSSIGGAIAGGIYLSKSKTTKKENDSNTKQGSQTAQNKSKAPETTTLKPAETPKPVVQGTVNTGSSGANVSHAGSPQQVTVASNSSQETQTALRT